VVGQDGVSTWARAAGASTTGDAATSGDAAARRATVLVVAVVCLLAISDAGYAVANSGPAAAPFAAALVVLPVLYAIPATRLWWLRHRCVLLSAQAALTYLPFACFGTSWPVGTSGWLAGLVLLTLPSLASWLAFAGLAVADITLRAGLVGLPYSPAASAALWILIAFATTALVLFGLGRLADLVAQVHAARGELAEAAVTAERARATDSLRLAIGDRLYTAAGQAAAALRAIAQSPANAREHIAATAATARRALAEVREVTGRYRDADGPGLGAAPSGGGTLAPRLARAVLVAVLCALAVQNVNDVAQNVITVGTAHFAAVVVGWAVADTIAIVALQLRHSWPSGAGGRPPCWPVTLGLQALLTYAMVPVLGWRPLVMCGFLAGSMLLLVPGRQAWAASAAVIASVPALLAVKPVPGLTSPEEISAAVYLTASATVFGLTVYGLTRLAQLTVQLEAVRGELAWMAVADERLRVARDTHDLLGLGLSAMALKADLIHRLIGRDDAKARTEIGELARICATARADMRLVTGEARDLPLEVELEAAREVLASAGIDVRMNISATPARDAAAVLVPVLREGVTNILRHSSASRCAVEMTAGPGVLRLQISNDGSTASPARVGHSGNGLANLAARVEAVGGSLTGVRSGRRFNLVAEIPAIPAAAPAQPTVNP
jgi:two-component system, NarL family, sensor histidine kinase DesK